MRGIILSAIGLKSIEEIEVGDEVLAYNEETGEQAYKPVTRLFRNETEEWYHVKINGEEIVCTGGHPFYILNAENDRNIVNFEGVKASGAGKWITAKELKISDKVLISDGSCGIIETVKVETLTTSETTYNFEVADFHTYYVSNSKVLVHNMCAKANGYDNKVIAQQGKLRIDLERGGSGSINLHLHAGKKKYMFDGIDSFIGAGRLNDTTFVKNGIKKALKTAKRLGWELK